VEKAVGFQESWLASFLIYTLLSFVRPRDLGIVTGEAGLIRFAPGLVRIPDVAFIAWDRLPGRRLPADAIPEIMPNLVIEVLSPGNTSGELARKCREYFDAGVQLVWLVDPRTRSVDVYTALDHMTRLSAMETLDGGRVLPGFTLSLQELFHELDRQVN
jgi:Uma2 family endonuclease